MSPTEQPPSAPPQLLDTVHAVKGRIERAIQLLQRAMESQKNPAASSPNDTSCPAKASEFELTAAMLNIHKQLKSAVGNKAETDKEESLARMPVPRLATPVAATAMLKQSEEACRTSSAPQQLQAAQAMLSAIDDGRSAAGPQTGNGLLLNRQHCLDHDKWGSCLPQVNVQPLDHNSNGQALQWQGNRCAIHCAIHCEGQASAPRAAPPTLGPRTPPQTTSSRQSTRLSSHVPKYQEEQLQPTRVREPGHHFWCTSMPHVHTAMCAMHNVPQDSLGLLCHQHVLAVSHVFWIAVSHVFWIAVDFRDHSS